MPRRVGKEVAQQVEVAPVQFNRQQQNNPTGGILGLQDPVEAAFRAAEQFNANQQRYETYGPALRPLVRPSYHKPYPDYIDRDNPFPRGFKVPEFTLFSRDASQSTIEHIEPEISMANLSRLTQRLGESSENYLMRFRKAWMKCHVALPEQEFVKLAQNGLDIELRKKFEGMEFRDFFELSYKVARYENLLREESQRKAASQGTYYQDAFDLDVAEVFADKPVTCPNLVKVIQQVEAAAKHLPYEFGRQYTFDVTKANEIFDYLKKSRHIKLPQGHRLPTDKIDKGLLRFPEKPKEAIGVDENPFPNVDVGVNVADIRSISRRTGQHHAARIYASGSRMKEARHTDHSRMVKPPQRPPSKRWEKVVHPKFPKEPVRNLRTLRRRLQRKRAEARHRQQLATEEVKVPQRSPAKGKMVWKRKENQELAVQNESQLKVPPPKLTSLIVNENELKATFEADQQAELTGDDNLLEDMDVLQIDNISINLSCLVLTLPLVFQAKGSETTHVSNGSMLVEEEVIEPLYISAHMDGVPVNRVLVDNGAAVNVIPPSMLRNLVKNSKDLVYTDVTISDFTGGVSKSKGVLPVALTVGSKTSMSAFFVVDSSATYNALLGRDWIHSNWCVPSSVHQRLIFWNGGKTEVVYTDNRPFLANCNMVEARYYDEDVGTIHFFGMDRQGRPRGITACNKPSLAKYVVDEVCNELLRPTAIIPYRLQEEPKIEENTEANLSEVVREGEEDTHTDGVTMEELDLAPAKLDDLRVDVQDPLNEVNLETEAKPRITFVSGLLPPEMRDQIICLLHEFKDCFAWDYSEMLATPKDEYLMPVADLLVDEVARHRILSFMDGHNGYNQIFIAEEDISKTTFRCAGNIGMYEWVVMPFGLKNAGATYQRAMNAILHDMIGRFMEIYIDDVVVKSMEDEEHLEHLRKAFERMRQHGLKMNPLKCAFGVTAGNFLGFLVHERGLEVDKNKARAVIEVRPPQNKKELQRFLGQPDADFKWERQHQAAFDAIKEYLSKLPVLVPLVLADFLAGHPCLDVNADENKGINLFSIDLVPWRLIFDGSSTDQASRAEIIIVSPDGIKTQWCFQLDFKCTNNQAEYEALVIGLELLVELKVPSVEIVGDSQLVLKQLSGEYKCTSVVLSPYFATAIQLLEEFDDVSLKHIPRNMNIEANELAQIASGVKMPKGILEKVIRVPASKIHLIVKPWPFRGWAIDLIGKIYPPSSKGHSFIIVATNYFTKWVEARPMKKVEQGDVITFIKEDLIHRFGLPKTITSDQGTTFVGSKVEAFAKDMGFHLLNSTPHYAQANGQAEASNKIIINILEKMADDNPRRWHELLSDTLSAYRTSQRSSTKVTPFSLTYGHDAVLPMELTTRSLRIAIQNGLNFGEYNEAMIMELEDLEEARLTALDVMKA
ncbi:hypothetical protein SLEP1_g14149 [Rubroshorea leprosula]|uniref:Uncharacterized protein n=1 Tax=Rubroshorea leprosula TaxID=152421 RepID=A0AAV5IP18_9ROSI|nr:hypothetical protein SLEP1_g14149 [Rubroshorea leprosula]